MPKIDRRLLVALLVSAALHASFGLVPGWPIPRASDDLSRTIEARLQAAPAVTSIGGNTLNGEARGTKARRRDEPSKRHAAEPIQRAAQPEPAAELGATPLLPQAPVEVPERKVEVAASQAEDATAVAESTPFQFPAAGRIRFVVLSGSGFELGEADHSWIVEGSAYTIRARLRTTGLVSLLREVDLSQISRGVLNSAGLQPVTFESRRSGLASERVVFDWSKGQVSMTAAGRDTQHALVAESQDILSVFYQASLAAPAVAKAWMVATGKGYSSHTFIPVGAERIETRLGLMDAIHYRIDGADTRQIVELWVARDFHNLPVRIRYTDRSGEVTEQQATGLQYPGVDLVPPKLERHQADPY